MQSKLLIFIILSFLLKETETKCFSGDVTIPNCYGEYKDNRDVYAICSDRNVIVYVKFPTPFYQETSFSYVVPSVMIALRHIDVSSGVSNQQHIYFGVTYENVTSYGFNARFYSLRGGVATWVLTAQWMACD